MLTTEQAEQALLSETAMGADFTGGEPSEDSNEGAPGCLSALDDMDDIGAETKTEVEYTSTSDIGLPTVEHSVFSYTEVEPISARIEEVSTALEGCDVVEETDEDGTEYALDVSVSTDTTSEECRRADHARGDRDRHVRGSGDPDRRLHELGAGREPRLGRRLHRHPGRRGDDDRGVRLLRHGRG